MRLARFSPDGRHLAVATAHNILYLIWDFARAEKGIPLTDVTEHLHMLHDEILDLCWDTQSRRLVVCAVCTVLNVFVDSRR